jgi:hypothetical protein
MADSSSRSSENSAATDDDYCWEVQDILAERRTFEGETEVLVNWKCTWTPISSMKDGRVLQKWLNTNKFITGHGNMAIKLPVIRGTQLFKDCIKIRKQQAEQKATAKLTGNATESPTKPSTHVIAGPRKQTGRTAKRRA